MRDERAFDLVPALESRAYEGRISANPRSSSAAADGGLEGRVNRLATERGVLFDKAAGSFGLSSAVRQRLHAIERELDECFFTRRQQRPARDANRFDRDLPLVGRARLPW